MAACGAAAFGGIEDGRAGFVGFDDADGGFGVGVFVEHDVFFLQDDQRALVAHHAFAVIAEAVAVDGRIGDDEFFAGIFDFGLLLVGVVAGLGEFVHAVDVIFALAMWREQMAAADGLNGERQRFFVFGIDGADENAGGIELVAAELGHQTAAGALPKPPADEFFQRIDLLVVGELPGAIAVAGSVDGFIFELLVQLGQVSFAEPSSCQWALADFKSASLALGNLMQRGF